MNNKIILLAFLLSALVSACIPAPGVLIALDGNYSLNFEAAENLGVPYSIENNTLTFYALYDDRVAIELNQRHLIAAPFTDDFAEAQKQNELINWEAVVHDQLVALANAGVLTIPDYDNASECAGASVIVGKNPLEEFLVTKECGEWKQYNDNQLKDGNARTFGCGGTLLQGALPSPAPSATPEIVIPYDKYEDKSPASWLDQLIEFFKSVLGIA